MQKNRILFRVIISILAASAANARPVVTVSLANKVVAAGSPAFFTVGATGDGPLKYQWRKDGADILGATGATLALGLARADLAGGYTVVVSDGGGSVTSAPPAMLTIEPEASGAVAIWGGQQSWSGGRASIRPGECDRCCRRTLSHRRAETRRGRVGVG